MLQTWNAGRWQVEIDQTTGLIRSITDQVTQSCVLLDALPLLTFTVNGRTPENTGCYHKVEGSEWIGHAPTLKSVKVSRQDAHTILTITHIEGNWEWYCTLSFNETKADIICSFGITLINGPTQLLRDAWVEWRQPVRENQQAVYSEPGYPPKAGIPAKAYRYWNQIPDGRCGSSSVNQLRDCPAFYPGLFVLWDEQAKTNWASWWYSTALPATAECQKHGNELIRRYRLYSCSRMHAGKSLTIGNIYFSGFEANRYTDNTDLSGFWAKAGKGTDRRQNEMVASMAIYEVYMGEKAGRTCYPSLPDITADLERIRSLGCNAIQLMPRMPMPAYRGITNYFDPAFNYGGSLELKELVEAAHRLDMRVILDIVLHGSPSPDDELGLRKWNGPPPVYRSVHPEWFIRHEDGRISHAHNDAFDLANPNLQEHISDALFWYVDVYDIDGFRIDAQNWNFFPNWDPNIAPREAYGNFYGAYSLIAKVRQKLQATRADVFIYTEWGGPINYGVYDTTYNYDESWIPAAILPVIDPRGEASFDPGLAETLTWPELAQWFQQRRSAFPRHALKIHHLDSHDTHEWKGLNQFRSEAFGTPGARALFALMALLDGGLLIFTGAETGNEDFYKWVLSLRMRARIGECHYLATGCSSNEKVATLLWTTGGGKGALVLVNLTDKEVQTEVLVDLDSAGMDQGIYNCTWEHFLNDEIKVDHPEHWTSVTPTTDGNLSLTVKLPAYGVGVCWLNK